MSVETLENIEGYKKLNAKKKVIFAFRLSEYLNSLDKDIIEHSDIISVTNDKKNKKFIVNMITYNKTIIVNLSYRKAKK